MCMRRACGHRGNIVLVGHSLAVMPSGSDHVDTSAVKQYKENIMSSLKYLARIVGLLYLIVGVFGGLAVG
jgi:hypothetical protein